MSISAMKQALEALVELNEVSKGPSAVCLPAEIDTAMDALRQAIAEAEKQVSYSGNGTSGRENMTAPTGFFFQMPKSEPEPVEWHEPGAYGNVTTHKDWALANGWEPLYKEKKT